VSVVVPRSAARLVIGALLALLLAGVVLIAVIGSLIQAQRQGCGEGALLGGPPTATAADGIPAELMPIFRAADQRYGVPWNALAAINKVETDFGRNMGVSSAGAIGWMQFIPATWRRYGIDGDHDGHKDPYNPRDAIPAAANYLRASGAQRDLRAAIFAYNHAAWYVQQVLSLAASYATGTAAPRAPDHGTPTSGDAATRRTADTSSFGPRAGAAAAKKDCAPAVTGPAALDTAVTLTGPRRFAPLPTWAMDRGRAPAFVDARILADIEWILVTYRLRVTAGREAGHLSHGDGTAVDMVPANATSQPAWNTSALRLAQDIGWTPACAASGAAPVCPLKAWVRFVGYNGYPNHGDPAHTGPLAHIHLSWYASAHGAATLSPPNDWVRVFPTPAPAATPGNRSGDSELSAGQRVDLTAPRTRAVQGREP
jgi:Transglycosylase SLT domain